MSLIKPTSDINGTHRTGGLKSSLAKSEIDRKLGFKPNCVGDSYKVEHEWGFTYDGQVCAIWDYKGSRWSTYGPDQAFIAIFGNDYVSERRGY